LPINGLTKVVETELGLQKGVIGPGDWEKDTGPRDWARVLAKGNGFKGAWAKVGRTSLQTGPGSPKAVWGGPFSGIGARKNPIWPQGRIIFPQVKKALWGLGPRKALLDGPQRGLGKETLVPGKSQGP